MTNPPQTWTIGPWQNENGDFAGLMARHTFKQTVQGKAFWRVNATGRDIAVRLRELAQFLENAERE